MADSNNSNPPVIFGANQSPGENYSDPSDLYANGKQLYIEFEYLFGDKDQSRNKVFWKAFITAYSDDYSSEWESEQVYGRPDAIQTFKNTSRTINLSFVVPSSGLREARENLAKASKMMRFLYPTYDTIGNATTIVKPPLLRMRFVNFAKSNSLHGLLGKVDGFSFTPNMDAGFWDGDYETGQMNNLLYPKTLEFSCAFQVIHEQPLGWSNGQWEVLGADAQGPPGGEVTSYPFMPTNSSVDGTLGYIPGPQVVEDNLTESEDSAAPDPSSDLLAQSIDQANDSSQENLAANEVYQSDYEDADVLAPDPEDEQTAIENEFFDPQSSN